MERNNRKYYTISWFALKSCNLSLSTVSYYYKIDYECYGIRMLTRVINYCEFRSDYLKLYDNRQRKEGYTRLGKNGVLKQNNGASVKYCKSGLMYHLRRISAVLTLPAQRWQ